MRTITLLNSKGGSGKSTLSTNLAAYLAQQGLRVGLLDTDPQGSSRDWLRARPAALPTIQLLTDEQVQSQHQVLDYLLVDLPSGVRGDNLQKVLEQSDYCVIPVLPSPHDVRAAAYLLREVRRSASVRAGRCKLAVVANRVRPHTVIFQTLHQFLSHLGIPFIATFRETQNYVRTAAHGVGVADMPRVQLATDFDEWVQLLRWMGVKVKEPAEKVYASR